MLIFKRYQELPPGFLTLLVSVSGRIHQETLRLAVVFLVVVLSSKTNVAVSCSNVNILQRRSFIPPSIPVSSPHDALYALQQTFHATFTGT